MGALALAFSGGLDSRFLAFTAARAGVPLHLFHVRGPHVPEAETGEALAWAAGRGMALTVLELNPLDSPEVADNTEQRCYHCKTRLFTALREAARAVPLENGRPFLLCDGTNASDRGQYRPGLRALEELGVLSPLALSGLTKDDIRACAAASGMDAPHQQARPCLLTRYAYGLRPSGASLLALGGAEAAIGRVLATRRNLLAAEAAPVDFRLRLVGPLPCEEGEAGGAREAGGGVPAPHPFVPELHVTAELPEQVVRELVRAVRGAGFVAPRVCVRPALSGYYDGKAESSPQTLAPGG